MTSFSPTYRAIAAQFTPMQDCDGQRLFSNPALVGSPEPRVLLADIVAMNGQYCFIGPALAGQSEPAQFQRVLVAGPAAVESFNQAKPLAERIHVASSHEAALAGVWQLISAHYGIADAAQQVVDEQLRVSTDEYRASEERRAQAERAEAAAETAFTRMGAAHAAFLASYQTPQRPAAIQELAGADAEFMVAMPGAAVWVQAEEEPGGLVLGLVSEAYERGDVRTKHGVSTWGHYCPLSYSEDEAHDFFAAARAALDYACSLT